MILSASRVVGPLAASAKILHFNLRAILAVMVSCGICCPKGKGSCKTSEESFVPSEEAKRELDEDGWVKYRGNPVFLKGEGRVWDMFGVTCFLVRHFPWGYMMYYSVSGQWTGFGLAESEDGITWTRHENNPVMVPDDSVTVWGPEVLHDGEVYHMWYVSRGPGMNGISHCTSEDGAQWTQSENNPVIDHGGCNSVIWDGERYRMHLQVNEGFELLFSDDGEEWELQGRAFNSGTVGNWDEITAAPSTAYYEGQFHLWYTGADTVGNQRGEIAIGHVVSDDWGESFEINEENREEHRVLRPTEVWEGRGLYSSGIDFDGENIYVWYAATGPDGGFGYATRPVENSVESRAVADQDELSMWTVSPNPTTGPVCINYLGTMDVAVSVWVYDLLGREVINREFGPNQPVVLNPSMLNLSAGQYFIKINARGKEINKRMVLVK